MFSFNGAGVRNSMRDQLHILVTAGPTREMLDPVRFLSNVSTGHMGYAIARAARTLGHEVTLVSGPATLTPPKKVRFVPVVTAEEMKRALVKAWPRTDVLIMTAAVCDYTPVRFSPQKIKRVRQKTIRFKRTPDILQFLGRRKGGRLLVGFALETEALLSNAARKLKKKNLDYLVANWYGRGNNPFGKRAASVILLGRAGKKICLPRMAKPKMARRILKEILAPCS